MATAIRITLAELKAFLDADNAGWVPVSQPDTTEHVFYWADPRIDHAGILVYSSIQIGTDRSRRVGKDAIRVVPFDTVAQRPLTHGMHRVHRVVGWRQNLNNRLAQARAFIAKIQRCPICGAAMVPRINRNSGREFMGCLNWQNHRDAPARWKPASPNGAKEPTGQPQAWPGRGSATQRQGTGPFPAEGQKTGPRGIATIVVNGDYPQVAVGTFKVVRFTDITQFNPIQSAVLPLVGRDENLVLASTTNTGKTKIAEMVIATCLAAGKPAIYASPLKALTQEKYDLWTSATHPFHSRRISIVTGDYRLTLARQKELAAAEIVLLTSEMLDSRCRNVNSERSEFLTRAGCVVADEFHLLGVPERGDKLEAGLMRFSALNPSARMVALSATLPNVAELAQWVQSLNGKRTTFVTSPWRAVPLHVDFRYFEKQRFYADTQRAILNATFATINEFPADDKVLVFVHTKVLGRMLLEECAKRDINAQFHCADLELGERLEVESSFRDRANHLRVVIATSTLAWGVNLPARRVIVCGVHRGLADVNELDILQMTGRAGRMGLDPVGDAYVLLPQPGADVWQRRIEHPGPIRSNLADPLVAKFHIISEIANGFCSTAPDIQAWYKRTLACAQRGAFSDDEVEALVQELLRDRAITQVAPGTYKATELGVCANYFYLDPALLHDLVDNWTRLWDPLKPGDPDDVDVAWAMSHTRLSDQLIVSRREEEALEGLSATFVGKSYDSLGRSQLKAFACYFNMLRGTKVDLLASTYRQLHQDSERLLTALQYLDGRFAHWGQSDWWTNLAIRFKYGVPQTLVALCRMKGVGRTYATRLYHGGITTPEQFFLYERKAKAILGDAVFQRIYGANYGNSELRKGVNDWTSTM